jgi:hypothetical protein
LGCTGLRGCVVARGAVVWRGRRLVRRARQAVMLCYASAVGRFYRSGWVSETPSFLEALVRRGRCRRGVSCVRFCGEDLF